MDDRATTQTTGFAAADPQRSGGRRLLAQAALWASAARARTLPASVAPVLIGVVLAYTDGVGHALAAVFALIGAILIQIGTNYANDYFDFVNGADTAERIGPRRLVQSGLVRPEAMRRATIIVFGLAVLVGLYLAARGGWPIVLVGVASILCGLLYTGGPFPLGYRGLGDVFVLLFFGPVAVAGTYYVQALDIDWRPIVAGLGPGLISAAILAVNNLRDRETDAKAGKRTLAVRLGVRFTRLEYTTCVVGRLPDAARLPGQRRRRCRHAAAAPDPAGLAVGAPHGLGRRRRGGAQRRARRDRQALDALCGAVLHRLGGVSGLSGLPLSCVHRRWRDRFGAPCRRLAWASARWQISAVRRRKSTMCAGCMARQ